MINAINLSGFDREFFELAAELGYGNPFGRRCPAVSEKLAGIIGKPVFVSLRRGRQGAIEGKEMLALVMKRVEDNIRQLERQGVWPAPLKYTCFDDKSRTLMRSVFLFRELYRYVNDFDELVIKQARRPEKNLSVPFASSIVYGMGIRGFAKEEALRGIALFYQMRRAHYFLGQGLTGQSDCMRQLRMDLWNCLFTEDVRFYEQRLCGRMEDFGVLICGPVGCGKGTAAEILGRCGFVPFDEGRGEFAENFMNLFLPVNVGRWDAGLVEGEVFGREGEAATGGKVYVGVLGQCRPWGTVFLEEIGDLSGPLQVKLLGVLEERSFVAVGGVTPRRFGGRVVAATSRSMGELIRQGVFREDLYYRLSAGCVRVPSLALRVEQNPDELRELAEYFVRQMAEGEHGGIVERVMGVIGKRRAYGWPGNVRELEQCVRRVMLTGECSGEDAASASGVERIAAGIEHERFTAEELTAEYCRYLMGRHRAYTDAARITGLDWRTVKGMINALES